MYQSASIVGGGTSFEYGRVNLRAGKKRQQRNKDIEEQKCGGIFISDEDRDSLFLKSDSIHSS